MKQALRRIARTILWPVRRFFDPRFAGLEAAIRENVQLTLDATDLLGRSIADVHALAQHTASRVENTFVEAERASGAYFERLLSGDVSQLDHPSAALLNHETGSEGFAAHSGLWFNPPMWVQYRAGGVVLGGVNERAAEIPYVLRGLNGIASGAKVLDVGATESIVAFSLASLGYEVTAIDPRPYPLSHPHLRVVVGAVEDWDPEESFDAVICLSTIEHIGVGAYGVAPGEGRDHVAMRSMRGLTVPGGRLLLTTRFGVSGVDELQRTYDRAGLDELLQGWSVEDLTFVRRVDETTWEVAEPVEAAAEEFVAMVTAVRTA